MKELLNSLSLEIEVARLQKLNYKWSNKFIADAKIIASFSRLYFPIEGTAEIIHHEHKYQLQRGNIYLIPPYSALEARCPVSMIKYWTHFNAYILNSHIDIFSIRKTIYKMPVDDMDETVNLFRRICHHYPNPVRQMNLEVDPLAKLEANSALTLLLTPFLKHISGSYMGISPESATMFDKLFDFIERNLSRPLTLEMLAEVVNVNPTYLTNMFTEKFGVPLIQYCNRLRIKRSVNLLLSKQYTVEEIAYKVGAGNPKVFSRLFKRHMGVTPSEYRKLKLDSS